MAEALARTPEPELMDAPEQVAAYAAADFSDANAMFVDALGEGWQPRPAKARLIDLGCGPGDICMRIARTCPGTVIEGLDAGVNMLAAARAAHRAAGLGERIELRHARLPDHGGPKQAFDAVVSNSLLHHLPDPAVLWQSITELAAPGAWVQVMDLERPRSAAAAEALVARHAGDAPDVLRRDFRNSLHAAWRVDEVRAQLDAAGLGLGCRRVSDRHWMVRGRIGAGGAT